MDHVDEAAADAAAQALTPADFDLDHGVIATSELLWRLAAEAFGEDFPDEVRPWGGTTWWVLGSCISGLRVGPGQTLVDLACGRGRTGLWLSRATGAHLVGSDWSLTAIQIASGMAGEFGPPDRARFLAGDLCASGLDSESADAVVCLDAIFFADDMVAALSEVRRILRPGGRLVFTADEKRERRRSSDVTDWAPLVRAADLAIESNEEIPRAFEQWSRMYELWLANLDAIRADIGEAGTASLEDEARTVGPTLANRRFKLIVARRPAD